MGVALCWVMFACGGGASSEPKDAGVSDATHCDADIDCVDWAGLAPCEKGICVESRCEATPADGAECDDGNLCTTGSLCENLTCTGGDTVVCDDDNACTDNGCHPDAGCVFAPNALPCDDGDACTAQDACDAGACASTGPTDCDDANECTSDACNSDTGCTYELAQFFLNGEFIHEGTCNDGNPCTKLGTCADGVCVSTKPVSCDDDNLCTDDACEDFVGCTATPNTSPCDDNSLCTTDDACVDGACTGGTPLDCNDVKTCTDDACEADSGCTHIVNTAPCNDNNACTTNDTCDQGDCHGGPAPVCDDKNPCTDDFCDVSLGCVATNNKDACDNGDLCTSGDVCSGGSCSAGETVVCDDGDGCTLDACLPNLGCVLVGESADFSPCNDNDASTQSDLCLSGACVGGHPHVVYAEASDDCGLQERESAGMQQVGEDIFGLFFFATNTPSCDKLNYSAAWSLNGVDVPIWHGQDAGHVRAADYRVAVGDDGLLAINMGWSMIFDNDLKDAAQALSPGNTLDYHDVSHGVLGSMDYDHYAIVGRDQGAQRGYAAHCSMDITGLWSCEVPSPMLNKSAYDFATVQMVTGVPDICVGLPVCPEPTLLHGIWMASNSTDGNVDLLFGDEQDTYSVVTSLPLANGAVNQSVRDVDGHVWFVGSGGMLIQCSHMPTPNCTSMVDALPKQSSIAFRAGWFYQDSLVLLGHQIGDGFTGPLLAALAAGEDPSLPSSWTLRLFDGPGVSSDVLTDGLMGPSGGFTLTGHRGNASQAYVLAYP